MTAVATRARLDAELVRRGLAASRDEAAGYIAAGQVTVGGMPAGKPTTVVGRDTPIVVAPVGDREWVSRGAHKLIGALDAFGVSPAGLRCLDAGASTGGFTDVLLDRGAAEVVAVDVGYGLLAWRVRSDERVHVHDRTNVRNLAPDAIDGPVDLTVADLSFISLRTVLPALLACTSPSGTLLPMVKPQFEVGRKLLPPGGVVRDPELRLEALTEVAQAARTLGAGGPRGGGEPVAGPVRQRRVLPPPRPHRPRCGRRRARCGRRGGPGMTPREILVVLHSGRETNRRVAATVAQRLAKDGIRLRVIGEEWAEVECDGLPEALAPRIVEGRPGCAEGAEVVLVLGGDGTLLRAAEMSRPVGTPLLGVNLGRIGFLAETEQDLLPAALDAIVDGEYAIEERMTLDAVARSNGDVLARTWALNEATVEKSIRERILEVVLEVDGRPVSAFGCDGVLCATPTGSTAYAFSAGGPLVWPQVEALLLVPSNAHALFARPMVISPDSEVAVEVDANGPPALLDCDGRRTFVLPPGARVEIARGAMPIRMVRLDGRPFADRLVRKFDLPVRGWRGAPSD